MNTLDVEKLTGLSSSLIYIKIKKGEFPKPTTIGVSNLKKFNWNKADIESWINSQSEQRLLYISSADLPPLVSMSLRTIYYQIEKGIFPPPIKRISGKKNLWVRKEIEQWLEERAEETKGLLLIKQVISLTKLSVNQIYNNVKRAEFPTPHKLKNGRLAWDEKDIESWCLIHNHTFCEHENTHEHLGYQEILELTGLVDPQVARLVKYKKFPPPIDTSDPFSPKWSKNAIVEWKNQKDEQFIGLINITELSKMLGLTASSIYAKISRGKLPKPKKIDGKNYWARADINKALKTKLKETKTLIDIKEMQAITKLTIGKLNVRVRHGYLPYPKKIDRKLVWVRKDIINIQKARSKFLLNKLDIGEVKVLTGLNFFTIYNKITQGCFPKSFKFEGHNYWERNEIIDWVIKNQSSSKNHTNKAQTS